jgi:LacI family transcriptional regulator
MRQVAQAVGVSVSTVSKALRNDPSIPQARCRSIQAAARKLGYRPHPMVATLMAQLHAHRRRSDPQSIAWIDLWPVRSARTAAMRDEFLLQGARERARELGYDIEVYPAGTQGMSPARLRRIITARGQWGLIIPPVPESCMRFPLDMRGLTGVTIGTSLHEPVMHRVSPNHFQGCVLALEQLRAKGYQRIGLVLTPAMNDRVEGKWLGAFLACQQQWPQGQRVKPLLANDEREILARWLHREDPDALLVAEEFRWPATTRLSGNRRRHPAIAWLMHPTGRCDLGHLDYRAAQLGRVTVEMVVAQIHRNERESPAMPHTTLIDAAWVELSSGTGSRRG